MFKIASFCTGFNIDKTVKADLAFSVKKLNPANSSSLIDLKLCIYKLINNEYELFQVIDVNEIPFEEYKEIHICDSGKVITLLKEHQTISALFVDRYVQKGNCYVAHRSID